MELFCVLLDGWTEIRTHFLEIFLAYHTYSTKKFLYVVHNF